MATPELALTLPDWTQLAAVVVGAVSGAVYAARRGFDVVGVLSLATVQGMGGLILRDTLLQTGTPVVLMDGRYLAGAAIASLVGFFFAGLLSRLDRVLVSLDALAMGFLCSVGASAALALRLDALPVLFIATVTATGGQVLRDLLAGSAPAVLRPGVFVAVAAVLGAGTFLLLSTRTDLPSGVVQTLTIAVVFAVRIAAIRLGWTTMPAQDLTDRMWSVWPRGAPR